MAKDWSFKEKLFLRCIFFLLSEELIFVFLAKVLVLLYLPFLKKIKLFIYPLKSCFIRSAQQNVKYIFLLQTLSK